MTRELFQALTGEYLLLDGATGSNLMKNGMPRGACTETWILEHPDTIAELQRAYVHAGSKVVYAPTFTANEYYLSQRGLGDRLESLNRDLVALSRQAVGNEIFVAGDITTVGRPDVSYEQLLEIYSRQAAALRNAGVDLFVIETMMGLDETMAALEACRMASELPVLCSFSVTSDGMLYFGGNVYDACSQLEEFGADAVGINCSCGPDQLGTIVKNLADRLSVPVMAKPNAGMPVIDEDGTAVYSMTPEEFAQQMKRLYQAGARILGGCCGTTPDHIAALSEIL